MLSESEDEVLGPLARFTRLFRWAVLLAGLAVLVLSVQPDPAKPGAAGGAAGGNAPHRAARLRQPRLGVEPGRVRGAGRLVQRHGGRSSGASFRRSATAAEIDRAVLSATDAASIVDTLLARTRDVFPCHLVGVTLVTPDGGKSLNGVMYDYCDDARHPPAWSSARRTCRTCSTDPTSSSSTSRVTRCRAISSPLVRLGAADGRGVAAPIPAAARRHARRSAIAAARPPRAEEHVQIRRLADQVAVALANARMLEQVRSLAYYDSLTGLPNRLSYKERLGAGAGPRAAERRSSSRPSSSTSTISAGSTTRWATRPATSSCSRSRFASAPAAGTGKTRSGRPQAAIARRRGASGRRRVHGHHAGPRERRGRGQARPPDPQQLWRIPFRSSGQEIFVNASIGIAIYPDDGEDLETLLMHADTAMYKAKEQGGSSYQAYSRAMNASALQRLTLENALRRAIEREEFELHYQPVVDARTGAVVGAEALVRWRHPELGLLLPSEFIALAEENGLIVPLGEWVLEQACGQNRAWQDAGLPPIRVVVNLSSRQLRRSFPDTVSGVLQRTGLEARFLGLELTESLLVNHQRENMDTLHALRAIGLHLAVDDFGTGYSSFSYLKHLPLDALKIDRSFVREITTSPDDAAITTAIIAMAHALNLKVVGEGIETEAQREVLRAAGLRRDAGIPVQPAGRRGTAWRSSLARTPAQPVARRLRTA